MQWKKGKLQTRNRMAQKGAQIRAAAAGTEGLTAGAACRGMCVCVCGANSIVVVVVVVVIRLNPVTDTGHYLMPCVVSPQPRRLLPACSCLLPAPAAACSCLLLLLLQLPAPAPCLLLPACCCCPAAPPRPLLLSVVVAQFFVNLSAARAAFSVLVDDAAVAVAVAVAVAASASAAVPCGSSLNHHDISSSSTLRLFANIAQRAAAAAGAAAEAALWPVCSSSSLRLLPLAVCSFVAAASPAHLILWPAG